LNVVYTLGYDAREPAKFLEILRKYGIRAVVDVRRFPKSKISYYSKESLESSLRENAIEYFWLGDELGGFRGGYIDHMKTEAFWRGIKKLLAIINNCSPIVILCKEYIPWRCHRRYIATVLKSLGFKVLHIIDLNKVIEHPYTLDKYGIRPFIF